MTEEQANEDAPLDERAKLEQAFEAGRQAGLVESEPEGMTYFNNGASRRTGAAGEPEYMADLEQLRNKLLKEGVQHSALLRHPEIIKFRSLHGWHGR